ncbi:hypothetical protein KUCAC02_026481 [Chaenocephalus aceratus]|uniref:Uncharacterized protein n=1 Tax=Chaenocephalus aceratus TaxID=36190 RepID=A0ACB9VXL1_CHAAC|nr:hypothetical protein KUCAC02_026481 [Chaenocephalus aceratus]
MLKVEFGVRFRILHVNAKEIRLFLNPFLADIDEAQPSYQFELAELQNCDVLKDTFKPNSLIDFYAALPNGTMCWPTGPMDLRQKVLEGSARSL